MKCKDCSFTAMKNNTRCAICRFKSADRERRRREAKKNPPKSNEQYMRNAMTLRDELLYDDGLALELRRSLIRAIDLWNPRKAAA